RDNLRGRAGYHAGAPVNRLRIERNRAHLPACRRRRWLTQLARHSGADRPVRQPGPLIVSVACADDDWASSALRAKAAMFVALPLESAAVERLKRPACQSAGLARMSREALKRAPPR